MPEGDLNPAQEKFFTRYINKGLFAKKRGQKTADFAAAFAAYKIADDTAIAALSGLPNYPGSSAEAAEKNQLFERYQQVQAETLKKQSGSTAAIAACVQAKVDLEAIAAAAAGLMTKALTDDTLDDAHRIALMKQTASVHLVQVLERFDADAAPLIKQIADNSDGTVINIPMKAELSQGVKALREKVVAVSDALSPSEAKAALDGIVDDADLLLATNLSGLSSFADPDMLVFTLANAQLDGQIRSALLIARANADNMDVWDVPDAKTFAAETDKLESRAAVLFARTTARSQDEAEASASARNQLLEEVTALNRRSAQAIQDKKFAFGQVFRDVEAGFAEVERDFRDIDDTSFAKGQAGPIIDFLSMTSAAINDLNGYNTAALDAARKLVQEAAAIVAKAQLASALNERITSQLTEIGRAINHGARPQNALSAKFDAYKAEHDDLTRNWSTMLLPDAMAAVKDFVSRVVADITLSRQLDARRTAARAELALAKEDLRLFNVAYGKMLQAYGRQAKPYEGAITNSMAQVEEWIETKTTLSFADTIDASLTRLRTEIGGLFDGLKATEGKSDDDINAEAVALQKELEALTRETTMVMTDRGEELDPLALQTARAAVDAQIAKLSVRNDLLGQDNAMERAKEEDAAKLEAYLTDARGWVKDTDDAIKAAQPGQPMHQYKEEVRAHVDRITATIKTVIKGKKLLAEPSELAFVKKTVGGIIARGPRTSVNELGRIPEDWRAAVDDFAEKTTAFLSLVESFATEQGEGDAFAALKSALTGVVNRLDRSAFNAMSADLANPVTMPKASEKVLQRVRYYEDLLLKDPVVQQCVLNPFGFRDFATPVANRLRQIELNVLRAS
tara:strand:+ start:6623 stop:9181 length:2559 start_codon:yes stop_codon:yes gene_type:complete